MLNQLVNKVVEASHLATVSLFTVDVDFCCQSRRGSGTEPVAVVLEGWGGRS